VCALVCAAPTAAQESEPTRRILGAEHLRVFYWPEHEELAEIAREAGGDAVTRLSGMLDMELEERIDIYIVRSRAEFDELTGTENKPWVIGRAMGHVREIVVKPMGPQRLPKLIGHELAHIMLDVRMGEQAHQLPRWLHEGIAKYAAEDFDETDRQLIARAALAEELLTIDGLADAFRGDREQVSLAYAQSYTLVQYLSEIQPGQGIAPLLEQLAKGRDTRLALGLAFHRPVPQIERDWLERLRTGYVQHVAPPMSEAIIGGLFVVTFIGAWLVVRRRSARIRERMKRQEQARRSAGLPPGPYTILPMPGQMPEARDDEREPPIE
jgi:hypothetical protein